MDTDRKKDLNTKLLDGDDPEGIINYGRKESKEHSWKCCTKLNNKTVLFIVCCLFACFASAEMTGALIANSLALLGDATASCVDVITYFTNLYAETLATPKSPPKSPEEGFSPIKTDSLTRSDAELALIDERTRLLHEVYVPTFSLITLVGVTVFIMILASIEITTGGDDDTNVNIMFGFAAVNAVIDITCITLFYYRKDDILNNRYPSFTGEPIVRTQSSPLNLNNVNINMFSAFTHIGSDTLRTVAIFVAAIISSSTGVKSSICDAWAAIVVSVTIFFAIIPLSTEVYAAYHGKRSERPQLH